MRVKQKGQTVPKVRVRGVEAAKRLWSGCSRHRSLVHAGAAARAVVLLHLQASCGQEPITRQSGWAHT